MESLYCYSNLQVNFTSPNHSVSQRNIYIKEYIFALLCLVCTPMAPFVQKCDRELNCSLETEECLLLTSINFTCATP